MTKWRDLKAQGIKRCCAVFQNGKRCRKRAANNSCWCATCGPKVEATLTRHVKALKAGGVMEENHDD